MDEYASDDLLNDGDDEDFLALDCGEDNNDASLKRDAADQDNDPTPIDYSQFRGKEANFEGGYRQYFEVKNTKLGEQFEREAQEIEALIKGDNGKALESIQNWEGDMVDDDGNTSYVRLSSENKTIFVGCTFYVDGYTRPSQRILRQLITRHGGNFSHYLDGAVSHLIATNLCDASIKSLRSGITVVKPEWIVDSIKNNLLLPLKGYQLYSREQLTGQRSLNFQKEDPSTKVSPVASPSNNHYYNIKKTSDDPNFVENFYRNSRLHHLSMWKTELRRMTEKYLQSLGQPLKDSADKGDPINVNERVIMHIDLDCFFASVALINRPDLRDKPVAVSHAAARQIEEGTTENLKNSSSDVASCNYKAREFGVRNGMSVAKAVSACPELTVLPYEFEKYRKVSDQFYKILFKYCRKIQAVSCDEAYLDVSELFIYQDNIDKESRVKNLAQTIKSEILETCKCDASIGISHNMILARMSTRVAKPNGIKYVSLDEAPNFMKRESVSDLPQVGWSNSSTLESMGISTCEELQKVSLKDLKEAFGEKLGETLYNNCRGIDNRELTNVSKRKSVSAEINYAIRLSNNEELKDLLQKLCVELSTRLHEEGVRGSIITVKMKKKSPLAAPEAKKYLGHGICNNASKSRNIFRAINDPKELYGVALELVKALDALPTEIRGIGIQVAGLEDESNSRSVQKSLLAFVSKEKKEIIDPPGKTDDPEEIQILSDVEELTAAADVGKEDIVIEDNQVVDPIVLSSSDEGPAVRKPKAKRKRKPVFKKVEEKNSKVRRTLTQMFKSKTANDDEDAELFTDDPSLSSSSSDLEFVNSPSKTPTKSGQRLAGNPIPAISKTPSCGMKLPQFEGLSELIDVCDLIGKWTEQFPDSPCEEDSIFVHAYMKRLVREGFSEAFQAIYRMIERKTGNSGNWANWLSDLKNSFKDQLIQQHESTSDDIAIIL